MLAGLTQLTGDIDKRLLRILGGLSITGQPKKCKILVSVSWWLLVHLRPLSQKSTMSLQRLENNGGMRKKILVFRLDLNFYWYHRKTWKFWGIPRHFLQESEERRKNLPLKTLVSPRTRFGLKLWNDCRSLERDPRRPLTSDILEKHQTKPGY